MGLNVHSDPHQGLADGAVLLLMEKQKETGTKDREGSPPARSKVLKWMA